MKALSVIHYPMFGGPHNEALRLAGALAEKGWELTVLLPDEAGNAASRLRAGAVEVITQPLGRFRSTANPFVQARMLLGCFRDINLLRRQIRLDHSDLVVVGGLLNPHAAIAAKLESVPVVWQIVDSQTPRILRVPLMQLVERLADAVLFDGEGIGRLHTGGRSIRPPSVVYFPPVDTRAFHPSSRTGERTRAELNIPLDVPVIGTVANIIRPKGIEYFVRAAGIVRRTMPNAFFVVIGAEYETQKTYAAQVRREVEEAGIPADRFIFTGGRDDVQNLYPIMDVKLITSIPDSEGTTTTAMEAMACGVPVIATDVGAVNEVVEHGVTGFVVPPLDVEAMAGAALRLLSDDALRVRLGRQARARAIIRFDTKTCADAHLRAYELALRRRGKTAGRGGVSQAA